MQYSWVFPFPMHKLFPLEMGLPPAYPEKEMTSMNAPEPYRVLFVCLGNICRSPAAEIIFKKWLQNKVWNIWLRAIPPE